MHRLPFIAAVAVLLIAIGNSGCKTAQPKPATKAEDAAAFEAWATWWAENYGWEPEAEPLTDLDSIRQAEEAQLVERLLKEAEAANQKDAPPFRGAH